MSKSRGGGSQGGGAAEFVEVCDLTAGSDDETPAAAGADAGTAGAGAGAVWTRVQRPRTVVGLDDDQQRPAAAAAAAGVAAVAALHAEEEEEEEEEERVRSV